MFVSESLEEQKFILPQDKYESLPEIVGTNKSLTSISKKQGRRGSQLESQNPSQKYQLIKEDDKGRLETFMRQPYHELLPKAKAFLPDIKVPYSQVQRYYQRQGFTSSISDRRILSRKLPPPFSKYFPGHQYGESSLSQWNVHDPPGKIFKPLAEYRIVCLQFQQLE